MAYAVVKKGRVSVYIYVNGKHRVLPRNQTRHLDGAPAETIDRFLKSLKPDSTPLTTPPSTPLLDRMKESYLAHARAEGADPQTVYHHEYCLRTHVFPYFCSQGKTNPRDWPSVSVRLRAWMRDRGLSEALIRSSNSALRKFWKFHTEEGNIRSVTQLLLRPSRIPKSRKAVLPKTLSSEEVLQFLKSQTDQDIKLLTLFGYFATLRPQETLALTRQDLKVDESLECCKVMREHGLYGKLAVRVDKQKSKSGEIKAPKAGSVGWVAIFDERAARMIAELVRPMAGALISIGADCAGKKFRKAGLGVTLKDLRRAGLYWLAHYGGLTYAALKNHARHSDPSTTWVYLRRPDEGEAVNDDLRL